MPRFKADLVPAKPKYVIIGLSLGNEGIAPLDEPDFVKGGFAKNHAQSMSELRIGEGVLITSP